MRIYNYWIFIIMNSRYYKSQFTIKPLFIFRNLQKRSVCLVFVCFIFSSNRNLTLNELERNLTRDVIIMNSKYYMNHNLQNTEHQSSFYNFYLLKFSNPFPLNYSRFQVSLWFIITKWFINISKMNLRDVKTVKFDE